MGRPPAGLTESSFLVLGLLTFGPRSGYDVIKLGSESIADIHRMPSKAQVYAELRKLEDAGLAGSEAVGQAGRPDKRVYAITLPGREALREWLQNVEAPALSGLSLVVIFFGAEIPAAAIAARLEGYAADAERHLAALRGIEARLLGGPSLHPLLVARAGIAQNEACARWARESLRTLIAADGLTRSDGRTPGEQPE